MIEKKVVVNLAVGISARRRLDECARSTGLPLGVVLERAIMAYEPGATVHPDRTAALESRIEALESALTALTAQVASLYQPNMEAAEIGSCALTEALPEEGTLGVAHPVISDVLESPEEGDLKESTPINLPSLDLAVLELAKQGFGPTEIAKKLNDRGYRTESGTPITKGHSTIKRVRDQVMKRLGG